MILMPKDLHNGVKHSGGYALWGAGKKGQDYPDARYRLLSCLR